MNKILIFLILYITLSINLFANPNIQARTGILIDYHSDKVLYEYEADAQIYPASMTKIMTTIIAFDLIKKNRLSLTDKFVVSENAWRLSQSGFSSMFIMVNDEVSVENLLKGIIIASGNDACIALAEGIAGTEEEFAKKMDEDEKAKIYEDHIHEVCHPCFALALHQNILIPLSHLQHSPLS